MNTYTIKPIIIGYTNTSKGNYLYHHSTHVFYDVEGFTELPVTIFLVRGNGHNILIDTGMSNTEIAGKYHHPGSYQLEGAAVYEQDIGGIDYDFCTGRKRFREVLTDSFCLRQYVMWIVI